MANIEYVKLDSIKDDYMVLVDGQEVGVVRQFTTTITKRDKGNSRRAVSNTNKKVWTYILPNQSVNYRRWFVSRKIAAEVMIEEM